jgi:hypothetical protein
VRCPATQQVIDTGIRTSGRDALTSGLYRDATAHCSHCRQLHPFEGNAFVEADAPALSNGLWRPNP